MKGNRFTIALLSIIMVCLPAVLAAVDYTADKPLAVYDFSTGAGTNKWAFRPETPATLSVNVPNTEFTSAQYDNIKTDNGVYQSDVTTTDGYYAAHRFNFSIVETSPTKINVTWNGIGDHDTLTDGATLYIYNFSAGAYEQLDSNSVSTDATLTGEKASNIGNYINAGNVTILVNQTSAQIYDEDAEEYRRSHICTDYIRLVITP